MKKELILKCMLSTYLILVVATILTLI